MSKIEYNYSKNMGLFNLGNTCYINSIIQCLSHSYIFYTFMISNEFDEDIREDLENCQLSKELRKILVLTGVSDETISTNVFNKYLQQYLLTNNNSGIFIGQHNDANEFLTLTLTFLNEHLSFKPKISININDDNLSAFDKIALKSCTTWKEHFKEKYSKIINLFYGQFISEVNNNDEITHCFDPFHNLDLEIPDNKSDNITIENCIESFMELEKLNSNVCKKFYLWKFPKILILTLKRFNNNGIKNNKRVIYRETLDLSKYCKGYNRENIKYSLFSICCHHGDTMHGHYTALCKKKNQQCWYKYDDDNVTCVTKDGAIPLTKDSYILMYELN